MLMPVAEQAEALVLHLIGQYHQQRVGSPVVDRLLKAEVFQHAVALSSYPLIYILIRASQPDCLIA
jgi:cobalamin biosynthesis Co2+ chelatase CbiK